MKTEATKSARESDIGKNDGLKAKLTFLGHNCFVFENEHVKVITDPWFTLKGAFEGTWHQYPSNAEWGDWLIRSIEKDKRKQYCYVSHAHEDHCDEEFLGHMSRIGKISIVIPEFCNRDLNEAVLRSGFQEEKVRRLGDKRTIQLGYECSLTMLIHEVGTNCDSAVLVRLGKETFLNQNDCKIHDRVQAIKERVTYFSCQFSGANYHPECFEYTRKRLTELRKKKIEMKLDLLCSTIKRLSPAYYIPSAGPAAFPFLNAGHPALDEDSTFISQVELERRLKSEGIGCVHYMKPGDIFDPERKGQPIGRPSERELEEYRVTRAEKLMCRGEILSKEVLLEEVRKRVKAFGKAEGTPLVQFVWGNGEKKDGITIDLRSGEVDGDLDAKKSIREVVRITGEPEFFGSLCRTDCWQKVFLGMGMRIRRMPDRYNNELNIFLYSSIRGLEQGKETTHGIPMERRKIQISEKTGTIRRYCPHQGGDLAKEEIIEGRYIRCKRHGWMFDMHEKGLHVESGLSLDLRMEGESSDGEAN